MKIRNTENVSLKKMQIVNTIIQFFLELMPLLCTFAIIVIYNTTNPIPLSPVTTFTVVALLGMLAGPLGILSNVARDKQLFNEAYINTTSVLNDFEEKPSESFVDTKMEQGRIIFKDVTMAISAGRARRDVKNIMTLKATPDKKPSSMPWTKMIKRIEFYLGTRQKPDEEDLEEDIKEVLVDIKTEIHAGSKVCLIRSGISYDHTVVPL